MKKLSAPLSLTVAALAVAPIHAASDYAKTRYPIVLSHGLFGSGAAKVNLIGHSHGTPAGCALTIPSPAKQRIAALLPEAVKWKAFMKAQEGRSDYYLKKGDVVEASIRSADGVIDPGVQHTVVVEQA